MDSQEEEGRSISERRLDSARNDGEELKMESIMCLVPLWQDKILKLL